MSNHHLNSEILSAILTELQLAREERQKILLQLENLEKILNPEAQKIEKIPEIEVNIDYQPLETMLKNGHWQEADQETARIMLSLVQQEKKGYLSENDLYKLPKNQLIELDQMWLKASNNKFGFSVQNQIYQTLGGRRFFEPEIWRNFGNKVGWYNGEKWLNYEELDFSDNAPIAHLPVMGDGLVWFVGGWEGSFNAFSLFLVKLIQFNII